MLDELREKLEKAIPKEFQDLIWFVVFILVFGLMQAPLHEWIHLSTLQFFGGDGYVYSTPISAYTIFTKEPTIFLPYSYFFIVFSGGFLLAIFYFVVFYLFPPKDIPFESATLPHIFSQLFYGVFEALWFCFGVPYTWCIYALYTGTLIGGAIGIFRLIKSWGLLD